MSATVKARLSIALPGGAMFSKQQCFENCKEGESVNPELTERHSFMLRGKDKKTGKPVSDRITYHTRRCVPAMQVINLSESAYAEMIGSSMPSWFRGNGKNWKKEWLALSEKDRLEKHLTRIAESLNGTVNDYQVYGD